jgi:hypothetical protein
MSAGTVLLAVGFDALLSTHGQSATYTPTGGAASAVTVIFAKPGELIEVEGVEIMDTVPVAWLKSSAIAAGVNAHGDTLVIAGTTYYIIESNPSADGIRTFVRLSTTAP